MDSDLRLFVKSQGLNIPDELGALRSVITSLLITFIFASL